MEHDNQLLGSLKNIRLTAEEKQKMWSSIKLKMQPSGGSPRQPGRIGKRFTNQTMFHTLVMKRAMPVLAAFLILVMGTGMSYAAEATLPGDALYPVKIYVNEAVKGSLILSADARAAWEEELAQRRLEEAEELNAEANISEDLQASIAERFQVHADRVRSHVSDLIKEGKDEDAATTSARFEATLKAHEAVMMQFQRGEGRAKRMTALIRVIREKAKDAEDARLYVEDRIAATGTGDLNLATEAGISDARESIAEVRATIEASGDLSDDVKTQIRVSIDNAEGTLNSIQQKLLSGSSTETFTQVRNSMKAAKEAKLMLKGHTSVKVKQSVTNGTASQSMSIGTDATIETNDDDDTDDDNEARDEDDDDDRDEDEEKDANDGDDDDGHTSIHINSNTETNVNVNVNQH